MKAFHTLKKELRKELSEGVIKKEEYWEELTELRREARERRSSYEYDTNVF